MPTQTFDLLDERILSSTAPTIVFGNGGTLTQTYRDLQLEFVGLAPANNLWLRIRFNGDSGSNYSSHYTMSDGVATPTASALTNETSIPEGSDGSTSSLLMVRFDIMSYKATDKKKNVIIRASGGVGHVSASISAWHSTSPITQITLAWGQTFPTSDMVSGTVARLWGIA